MIVNVFMTLETSIYGSDVSELLQIEIPDNSTEEEQEEIIDKEYHEFVVNRNQGGWYIPDEEKLKQLKKEGYCKNVT